jgi:hypothetical protein
MLATCFLLLVILVIGVLFVPAQGGKSRRSNNISNPKQIMTAFFLYSLDNDDAPPIWTPLASQTPYPEAQLVGWAGRLMPYLKSSALLKIKNEPAALTDWDIQLPTNERRTTVSFAMNSNLGEVKNLNEISNPERVTTLFEVHGNKPRVNLTDEGRGKYRAGSMSPSGDGTAVGLLANPPEWPRDVDTQYATGPMDNVDAQDLKTYALLLSSRNGKAIFAAADGHVVMLQGKSVSR